MTDIETKSKRQASKRWTEEEELELTSAFKNGASPEEIAEMLERTTGAIEARLIMLDLISYGPYNELVHLSHIPNFEGTPPNNGKRWEEVEEATLLASHNANPTVENMLKTAEELGRSPRSLIIKLVNLGAIVPTVNHNPNPKVKSTAKPAMEEEPPAPIKTIKVSITPEFQAGLKTIENGENLLVLGSAGTGKSTFLKWLIKRISMGANPKNYVVLAPTGMAAFQVGGQTIHSFFGFKPQLMADASAWRKPRNPKIYENLDLVIIDEISMVRADVFESIDKFLRIYGPKKGEPFGGVQILAMGDLFQLSPIVRNDERDYFKDLFGTPFFFGTNAWQTGEFSVLEFTKIFRQQDEPFIDLLNRVRHGERSNNLLNALNKRVTAKSPEGSVILAARNMTVDAINERELNRLATPEKIYKARTTGKVDTGSFTSPVELTLKVGARVMFTRNDVSGRWVNGTLGEVIHLDPINVTVKTDDGKSHIVKPVKLELTKYVYDEELEKPMATIAGTFSQLPLTLAWALTIHKAQGQTLETCTVDLSDGGAFAEGQLYVALSRARALESIHLATEITYADIRTSNDVQSFYKTFRNLQ